MEDVAYSEMYEQEDRHWWFRGRREVIKALLEKAVLPSRPRMLDAGCGTGRNLIEFGESETSSGVDPSPDAVEFCLQRGLQNVKCGSLESLPFEPGVFDLLLACDVLEHVADDSLALRELRRVADKGAYLVITVPAYQWMWSEHDVQLHHLRRYTMRALSRTVTGSGWKLIHTTYFNSLLLPFVAGARVVSRGARRQGHTDLDRTPEKVNDALVLPFKIEAALVRRGTRFPAGVSIGMLCRRATWPQEPVGAEVLSIGNLRSDRNG
jgi:SAM-dependent methyltransferase